jgi:F-type H+-transporting ATPase subunit delta
MPLLNTITTPYAEAFMQVCQANGDLETVIDQAKRGAGPLARIHPTA